MGQMINFERPDGGHTRGYLASAGTGRPGLVVIQEWWGLNDQICGIVQHLAAGGGKVAVMGFCMGGALTIASCVHIPEVAAGVCFDGIAPKDFADPAAIAVPFQAHFANRDDWCTPAAADGLEQGMKAAGRVPEVHRYEAAHGFFNERRGDVYDAGCAQQAWDRMAAFLQRAL